MAGASGDLLFKIGADSAEGETALAQFRGLLSRDLAGMGSAFNAWGANVTAVLGNAKIAMLAAGTALAAGVMAAGAGLAEAAKRAAEYADEIDDASAVTGIAVEELSKLRYTAKMSDVQFGELTGAMRFFARTMDEARKGTGEQAEAFERMGISTAEVEGGMKNMLPLLMRVSDAFARNSSAVEKAAIARQIFGRGVGPDFIDMLNKGSGALEKFNQHAADLGLVLTRESIDMAQKFRAASKELEARQEALSLRTGQTMMPIVRWWTQVKLAVLEGLEALGGGDDRGIDKGASFLGRFLGHYRKIGKELDALTEGAKGKGERPFTPPEVPAKVFQDFEGLSNLLMQTRGRLAELSGEEARLGFEAGKMGKEVEDAAAKLWKLKGEEKITGETFRRERQALLMLPGAMREYIERQWREITERREAAQREAAKEIEERIRGQMPGGYEAQREALERDIAAMRDGYREKQALTAELTAENEARLAELREVGHRRIDREQHEAWTRELTGLHQHLSDIVTARMTARERLAWQYQQDLVRFGEVEEAKLLAVAQGEAQQHATREMFALLRTAALERYDGDLQVLRNSEGWQAVFGRGFGELIRGNEELLREWAESANQSLLMVRVATAALAETMRRGFGIAAQAMAGAIAQAVVYRSSIAEAMREVAARALEGIAAESMVQAIYATALGFLRLAQWDYKGAAAAFKAAALFGTVGAVAAVAGRAVAPGRESAAAGRGETGGSSGARAAEARSTGRQGPQVTIYVQGHVIGQAGVQELTEIINEAVMGRDVRLVATQVRQQTRAIR